MTHSAESRPVEQSVSSLPRVVRVLVVSNGPLRMDNAYGNSFFNIFSDIPEIETANVYCQDGFPDSDICSSYYQITPGSLLRSMLRSGQPSGAVVSPRPPSNNQVPCTGNMRRGVSCMGFTRAHRWRVFFWMRELIWCTGRWRSKELDRFVDEFRPEVIFLPIYNHVYPYRIALYARRRVGARMVLYASDDNYSLRQYSFSPLFWMDRLVKRRWIRAAVRESRLMYAISDVQRMEYEEALRIRCKILFKCGDFSGPAPLKVRVGTPLKLVFTGNVGTGRWESLARIGEALREVNRDGVRAQLDIYTMTTLTAAMRRRLDDGRNIILRGALGAGDVATVQRDADVLVHVESFDRRHYQATRQSFSTKIVDYLQRARCILAVGSGECASIEYVRKNDAGLVATSFAMIEEQLNALVSAPRLVVEYGHKAYLCGRTHHQQEGIKGMLKEDLLSLAQGSDSSRCMCPAARLADEGVSVECGGERQS